MKTRERLVKAAQHGADYLDSLATRPVQPEATIHSLRAALAKPLPQQGCADDEVIEDLVRAVEPGLLASSGPRFFGWVIGGALPSSIAADYLVSSWDQNAAAFACGPSAAVVEEVAGTWLKELLGLPASCSYAFVTGCQMAHVTGLAAARYRLLERAGWDVNLKGLMGAPMLRVLTGEHHHETLARALRLLGLGTDAIECVALDSAGRLSPEALRAALEQAPSQATIVCLQAGDLNTGVFDSFAPLCAIAHEFQAWVHVDGAFGLWAGLSPEHKHLLAGIELADSWATDGHKWLNLPYDSGYVFVADAQAHHASMAMHASYVIHGDHDGRNQNDYNPEWSRRARSLPTYAAIRALGREGIAEIISRCCALATKLVTDIGALPEAEIIVAPIINQGLLRFPDAAGDHDRRTDAVVEAIQKEGTAWFGGSTWRGMRVMRVSVCNYRTTEADIDATVAAVRRVLSSMF
jgi:glutamate/tyrosine decarboxylase-like PLP-dependent enzyme